VIHRFFFAYVLYPFTERLTGRDIRSKVRVLESQAALPFSDRKRSAAKRLAAVLKHAGEHVPYYRELYARVGFDPAKVERDPAYVQRLPYLTKDIVRQEGKRLLSDKAADCALHKRKTGGSTGPSAVIYYDQEALDWTAAAHQLVVSWTGKRRHWKEAHLATRSPERFPFKDRVKEWVKCCALNRVNLFTDALDDRELEALWQLILKERPYLIQGHPSTLYALARHVAARGHKVDNPFSVFESTGEQLQPRKRAFIEEVLHCRTMNRYGNTEFGVVAYQRGGSDSDELHVLDFLVWPESAITEDGSHELVFTGLTNMAMPLIRYRMGDLAEVLERPDGWYLTAVAGRVYEMVNIGGKRYPTHYIQDVLDRIRGVAEFQIVERDGKVPLIRLVPESDSSHESLTEQIQTYWGNHVQLTFVTQDALERRGWRAKFHRLLREARPGDTPVPEG
jgi:phenylacetate-CoA ligase